MSPDSNLVEYYAKRAAEYEKIYLKPERQNDLAVLRQQLPDELAGEDVLEIACGTGYWTQIAAQTAQSILATDINDEVLQIARAKTYPNGNVVFENRDLFQLSGLPNRFTVGLAAFWWSHLKKSEIAGFLKQFHEALAPNAKVVFMDNNYVPGSSFPISRTDARETPISKESWKTARSMKSSKTSRLNPNSAKPLQTLPKTFASLT